MEATLERLIDSLRSASDTLKDASIARELETSLHDTDKLPEKKLASLASEALDLLSSLRLSLEPGHLVLADHYFGYMNTKALCTAVDMNIPDILRSGPMTLSQLADSCKARPDKLRQVMQTLRNNGVFSFRDNDTYENNHVSRLLLSDHWTQWRNWVQLYGNEFYDMARGIPEACKAGAIRSPAQINYDTDDGMLKYFGDQGWIPKFQRTLGGGAVAQAKGMLEDYPWDQVADSTVYDLGGGGGGLISLLLREFKNMKGGIVETPVVVKEALANFHGPDGVYADVRERIPKENIICGDFFQQVPPAEVYTMKWCLHNWDDEKAKVILTTVRKAIKKSPRSRLVVLEAVLQDGHMGRISRYGDMNMMIAVNGEERDEKTWRKLAAETGWEIRHIYPLRNAWPCAIEFVPVWQQGRVPASVKFLEPWDGSKGNPFVRMSPAPGYERMNFQWQEYTIDVEDARPIKQAFSLDTHGFGFYDDELPQTTIDQLRVDNDAVKALYYQHVEDFVKKITGARRIIIFDHTMRKRRLDLEKTQNDDGKEQPATMVHCDQSELGAIRRLKMNIGPDEDVDELLEKRVEMINVWRPLNGPVQDWPLATMDYRTVNGEMYPCDLLKGENEFRGQTATFTHSDSQKWYYLDKQRTDEVTVIKIWDSKTDGAKYCAHVAFNHPDAPPDIEPRESIEVRCLVIH